jgi:hypothetical protein
MNGENVFNTGRVRIGSQYQPAQRVEMDRDALRLQRALLGDRAGIDADGIVIVICAAAAVALAAMVWVGWI